MPSNVRIRCSHLLEARLLVDAADPQHGAYMEGTDAMKPPLSPEASNTAPKIISMPRTGNGLEGDIPRAPSLVGAISGERNAHRRLSQGTVRMHQSQRYMLEEENRASLLNIVVDWKHGQRETYGITDGHGGGDISSLMDETTARYRKREEAEKGMEGRGLEGVEMMGKEDAYSEEGGGKVEEERAKGVKEEEYSTEEDEYHAGSTLRVSSHSAQHEKETEENGEGQDSSDLGPSSFIYRLVPREIGMEESAEGKNEAQAGPGLHGTKNPLPLLEGGSEVFLSSHYRREGDSEGCNEGSQEGVYHHGFDSNTDGDLQNMHREPGGEEARYEHSSDYDIYFSAETLEGWRQLKRVGLGTDRMENEVGHLPVKPLNASSMKSGLDHEAVVGVGGAEEDPTNAPSPAAGGKTRGKLRRKPGP